MLNFRTDLTWKNILLLLRAIYKYPRELFIHQSKRMFLYYFFLCILLAAMLLLSNAIFRMSVLGMLQQHQEEALLGKQQLNNPS